MLVMGEFATESELILATRTSSTEIIIPATALTAAPPDRRWKAA